VRGVGAALADPSKIRLVHVGTLMKASDVISRPTRFFTDGVDTLVAHVTATAPTAEEGMARLLGSDEVRGQLISLEERSLRLGKAVMTGTVELDASGLDPALLFEGRFLDSTVEFIRGYIMRAGFEHGARFELRKIVEMDVELPGLQFRHQLRIPTLSGTELRSGPDTIFYYGNTAYSVQLKSFRSLDSLLNGYLTWKEESRLITKVAGPAIPKQTFTDALRHGHWDGKVPGPTAVAPTTAGKPADLTGWYDLSNTTVYVIDDQYLLNRVMTLLSDAGRRTRRRRIVLGTDVNASVPTQAWLTDMFGGDTVSIGDQEEVWDTAWIWIRAQLDHVQEDINRYLLRSDVVDRLEGPHEVQLLSATDGSDAIPAAVGITP
jgi:hypothetical protein